MVSDEFVRVVNVMGNDTDVVNAARVSFGKTITEMKQKDKELLIFLAKNNHTSPFRHCFVSFHIKAPEFVARQWYKHIIGSEYTFKDCGWNEISGRYVKYDTTFWQPNQLRQQSPDKKQGSTNISIENEQEALELYKKTTEECMNVYNKLMAMGVCREQARTILPLNFYTEWYWTASLQAIFNFVKLRTEEHAQLEIQEYASKLDSLMLELFPNAWTALQIL